MDLCMSFIFSYCPPILFFFSSWMGLSVRMVLTTARASITPCLFVFTHTFFVLFLLPFLFFFVLICMLGGIFNEKELGFCLVSSATHCLSLSSPIRRRTCFRS